MLYWIVEIEIIYVWPFNIERDHLCMRERERERAHIYLQLYLIFYSFSHILKGCGSSSTFYKLNFLFIWCRPYMHLFKICIRKKEFVLNKDNKTICFTSKQRGFIPFLLYNKIIYTYHSPSRFVSSLYLYHHS